MNKLFCIVVDCVIFCDGFDDGVKVIVCEYYIGGVFGNCGIVFYGNFDVCVFECWSIIYIIVCYCDDVVLLF